MPRNETAQHKAAFLVWYEHDRNFAEICENLRTSDDTLRRWADKFGWQERADKLDIIATRKAERGAIDRKAKMIESQRITGFNLRTLGARWLREHENTAVESLKDAVTAIEKGFALERQAEGLPDWVLTIVNADDNELQDEYTQLLQRCQAAFSDPGGTDSTRFALAGNGEDEAG